MRFDYLAFILAALGLSTACECPSSLPFCYTDGYCYNDRTRQEWSYSGSCGATVWSSSCSRGSGGGSITASPPPPSPSCAAVKAECTQSCTNQGLHDITNTCVINGFSETKKCTCSSTSASSLGSGQEAVLIKMQATGDVSDYGYLKQEQIKTDVATNAGVSSSYVMVAVTAGSVNIYAQITIPNGWTASAIKTQVANTLGDATKASTALGISVTLATVSTTSTTAVSQSIAKDNSRLSSGINKSSSSGINIGIIAGVAAGGAVAVAVLGGGAYYIWKQKKLVTITA